MQRPKGCCVELGNWPLKVQLGSTNSKGLPVLFQGSHQGSFLNNHWSALVPSVTPPPGCRRLSCVACVPSVSLLHPNVHGGSMPLFFGFLLPHIHPMPQPQPPQQHEQQTTLLNRPTATPRTDPSTIQDSRPLAGQAGTPPHPLLSCSLKQLKPRLEHPSELLSVSPDRPLQAKSLHTGPCVRAARGHVDTQAAL